MDSKINVVCINVGHKHPDIYVDRLYSMTERNLGVPFTFTCFTDRRRPLRSEIQQFDCSHWGVEGWFNKIKLFDGDAIPYETMLFMDVSIVIKDSLDPLMEYTTSNDLVAMRDWNYDCFGSCVMWIKKSDLTQAIWDEYASGVRYETRLQGDQDFIDSVLKARSLEEQVAYFPQEWFESYKRLLRAHRTSPEEANRMLDKAKIIKFHGKPRPHDILSTWGKLRHVAVKYPRTILKDWGYLEREIREWWR